MALWAARQAELQALSHRELVALILKKEYPTDRTEIGTLLNESLRASTSYKRAASHSDALTESEHITKKRKQRTKADRSALSLADETVGTAKSASSRGRRAFDMSKYSLRHVALKLAYVGTNYCGFASQESGERTVEEELFRALEKTCLITDRHNFNYSRCGRTDKGVHARGQVVAGFLRSHVHSGLGVVPPQTTVLAQPQESKWAVEAQEAVSSSSLASGANNSGTKQQYPQTEKKQQDAREQQELDYPLILNRVLPSDIRVLGWAPVALDFSARFNCSYRLYKYYFFADDLNITAMQAAAQRLVGTHDFRNFCKMDAVSVAHFTRTIESFTINPAPSVHAMPRKHDNLCECRVASSSTQAPPPHPDSWFEMTVKGNAFLWHQVRCMAAVLFCIGQGQDPPEIIDELLDIQKFPRKPQYALASEMPLILHECGFPQIQWILTEDNLQRVFADFHSAWRSASIQNRVMECCWQSLEQQIRAFRPQSSSSASSSFASSNIMAGVGLDGAVSSPTSALCSSSTGDCAFEMDIRGWQLEKRQRNRQRLLSFAQRPTEKSQSERLSSLSGCKLKQKMQIALKAETKRAEKEAKLLSQN